MAASSSSAVDDAQAALEAAGERQRQIGELKAEYQQRLDALAAQRKGKGSGRPDSRHASRKKHAEATLERLNRGILPGEREPPPPLTATALRASAAQYPQHHASAGVAPSGRAGRGGANCAARDDGAAARAGGGGAGGASRCAAEDVGDDDEADANFHHFYKVSPAQKAFNESVASDYMNGNCDRKQITVTPCELIGGGCARDLAGLGSVHIFAPQLHIGLPLPPCPRHGWVSVEQGKLRTRGCCTARRVYAPVVDECGSSAC